jgi:CheY-like chemotaxis protein
MPDGGVLTVRTRVLAAAAGGADGRPGPRVCVEVADTGVGMDEDTRRRCLEPFFTTKGERGTGLGLAMVYGVAQRHKADVEIDSWQGAGSVLRLLFAPARASEEAAAAGAPGTQAYALPPRLRLLVIDDDPVLLKSLRNILETDGHVVSTAHGGADGVAAFEAAQAGPTPFAAVVTDLGMPYVDGRQVAAAIKRCAPATPVILLTGWGAQLIEDGDIPAHVDHVLSKPPKLRELRAALAGFGARAAAEGEAGDAARA